MGSLIDLSGKRFGRLMVLEYIGKAKWKCQCDCGIVKAIDGHSLRRGHTISCGCRGRDKNNAARLIHGKTHTRLYQIWYGMKRRCYNEKDSSFKFYGLKGITVCPEWQHDYKCFEEWAETNGYENNLTIDRIDGNKGYSPDNCRWVSRKLQAENRSTSIFITLNGKTQTLTDWCKELQLNYSTTYTRIKRDGWSIGKALMPLVKEREGV